jgi:hypothetical protein
MFLPLNIDSNEMIHSTIFKILGWNKMMTNLLNLGTLTLGFDILNVALPFTPQLCYDWWETYPSDTELISYCFGQVR